MVYVLGLGHLSERFGSGDVRREALLAPQMVSRTLKALSAFHWGSSQSPLPAATGSQALTCRQGMSGQAFPAHQPIPSARLRRAGGKQQDAPSQQAQSPRLQHTAPPEC